LHNFRKVRTIRGMGTVFSSGGGPARSRIETIVDAIIALDERGETIDSATFARHLGRWRDESVPTAVFLIGGADGLSPELRRKVKLSVAFGKATWPHQMVRVMLLEQIYRAATILSGHPYHRA